MAAASNESVGTYRPGFPVYSVAWSMRPDQPLRFAVGSFMETAQNKVALLAGRPNQAGGGSDLSVTDVHQGIRQGG